MVALRTTRNLSEYVTKMHRRRLSLTRYV